MTDKFPSWYYGPNNQAEIFDSEADVPKGWEDHPTKVKSAASPPKAPPAKSETKPETKPAASPPANAELDADGHAYDPALHAGTGSKTQAGLWRMKVGVKRPAPVKPPLDL